MTDQNVVVINNKKYNEADLSDQTKMLLQIYSQWKADLEKSKLEVSKNEAAVRELSREIIESVGNTTPIEDTSENTTSVSE